MLVPKTIYQEPLEKTLLTLSGPPTRRTSSVRLRKAPGLPLPEALLHAELSTELAEPSEPMMYTLLHVQIHSYRRLGLFWIVFTKIAQCGGSVNLVALLWECSLSEHDNLSKRRAHGRALRDHCMHIRSEGPPRSAHCVTS